MTAMAQRLRAAGYIIPRMRFLTVAELVREVERFGFDPETTEIQVGREQVTDDGWGVYRDDEGVPIVHFYTPEDDDDDCWPATA